MLSNTNEEENQTVRISALCSGFMFIACSVAVSRFPALGFSCIYFSSESYGSVILELCTI